MPGRMDQGASFDRNTVIRIADYPGLRPTDGTTISAWIRPDQTGDRVFLDRTNVARYFTMMVIKTAKEETAVRL